MMKYIELLLRFFLGLFLLQGVWMTFQNQGKDAVAYYLLAGVFWLLIQPTKNRRQ